MSEKCPNCGRPLEVGPGVGGVGELCICGEEQLRACIKEKDARIRELVEKVRLATYCDFHEADGTLDCEECEEVRAALARSSEVPK